MDDGKENNLTALNEQDTFTTTLSHNQNPDCHNRIIIDEPNKNDHQALQNNGTNFVTFV